MNGRSCTPKFNTQGVFSIRKSNLWIYFMLFTVSQGYCFRIMRQNMSWISFHRQATRSLWALLLTACRAIKTRNEPHAAQFTPLWAVQMPGATLSCQPVGCLYRYLSHTHTHTSSLSSLPPLQSDMCTNSLMLRDLQSTPTQHVDCDLKGRNQMRVEQVSMQRCDFNRCIHIYNCIFIKENQHFHCCHQNKIRAGWPFTATSDCINRNAFTNQIGPGGVLAIHLSQKDHLCVRHDCWRRESRLWIKSLKRIVSIFEFIKLALILLLHELGINYFQNSPDLSKTLLQTSSNVLANIKQHQQPPSTP